MPESAEIARMMHSSTASRLAAGFISTLAFVFATLPAHAAALEQPSGASPSTLSVKIIRDGFGVPHVYAATRYDLFFGYGYAVAEDRLFQIEMAKRTFNGRVAEFLGAVYVEHDPPPRRLSTPASIERQLAALPAADRAILEGYTAGINKRIVEVLSSENKARLLPKQF